jgi:predicted nucleic acid-binding protein
MSRIYWDTMLFIYWMEDNPQFAARVSEIRSRMRERNDELITGALTVGEVLAGVYGKATVERARQTKAMLESAVDLVVPFTIETADLYGQIRGSMNVPPADAIHLASAAQARADLFLTNDNRLVGKFVPGIQFIASLQAPLF